MDWNELLVGQIHGWNHAPDAFVITKLTHRGHSYIYVNAASKIEYTIHKFDTFNGDITLLTNIFVGEL